MSSDNDEEWCEIREHPNYLVSNYGRVYSTKTDTLLRPRPSGYGYLQVVIYDYGRTYTLTVHKLVAEAFVPGWDEGLEANHKKGDKFNNHETNLEWVTHGMNNQHAIDTGLRYPRSTPVRVIETGQIFSSVKECANALGIFSTGISAVLNGRFPHYKGMTFAYAS